ncbi:RNA polymerase I specific transcription initiation factor [Geosmithia morbida]|uniref:RNA polymerase I specific transcription initiation factor n=1 Tax=Geosmithia morbida TaxID=1094350 RepID=A0A9P4Z1T0_9HYPO|nr:RNA polymerase I specific transcription initiation factor [Geosmithia morbida]KAF4125069.1 RNA polymerase I specific transcription initiation factor [Geosmithia morbida]
MERDEQDHPTSISVQWKELDNDEIASVASEDLHKNRPNRWRGAKSTWRALTEEERRLWWSMRRLGDQDLSIHLYNAFALKKQGKDPATAQDLTVQRENGENVVWAPPKSWTAWPLGDGRLPEEDFVARQDDDGNDRFTFRKKEVKMPSSDLHDELDATILRMAKKRFLRRKKRWDAKRQSIVDAGDEYQEEEPRRRYRQQARWGSVPRTFEPTVLANDDYAHRLLAPSVRHTLTRLDSTLQILHYTRATAGNDSESSTGDDTDHSQPTTPRRHKRPRISTAELQQQQQQQQQQPKMTRRGRPRKAQIPLEGETREEMELRIARQNHRRLPPKQDALSFEEWLRQGDERRARGQEENGVHNGDDDGSSDGSKRSNADEKLPSASTRSTAAFAAVNRDRRLGLRDWSDVIGAASLAGFHPSVIARTAKRCATLFGETMTVRTLHEVPVSRGTGVQTVHHEPSVPDMAPLSSANEDEVDNYSSSSSAASTVSRRSHSRSYSRSRSRLRRTTTTSRQGSRAPTSPPPRFGTPSSARARSRSRSASAGQLHFCPVLGCQRAARGFPRRANLRRHMTLVHGGGGGGGGGEDGVVGAGNHVPSSPGGTTINSAGVDSDDEVVGAVHVDGFLRAVVPGRGGWQNAPASATARKRRRVRRRRGRSGSEDDSDEAEYDGDSD